MLFRKHNQDGGGLAEDVLTLEQNNYVIDKLAVKSLLRRHGNVDLCR